jgi:hypothetical protein
MNTILENLIDENFILEYNKDLSQMTKKHLKQHYIQKGQKEGRILSNLHIQQILRNRYFNINFYKRHYDDTNGKNMREIITHYIAVGHQEGRIVSKKHAAILTNNPEFDIEFYKSHHPDLHNMTPTQLVTHYIEYGKAEGRIVYNKHNINPYNIVSISHSMGGGTQTYINNISKIHNININYEICINTQETFTLKHNDTFVKCDDTYKLSNIISDNTIVLFNHLLTNKYMVNKKFFYNVYNNCKRSKIIFIIHDYHLMYPANPSPVKNNDGYPIPSDDNLQFANDVFSKCDLVVFNSYNCFNNYKKYINLDNYKCIVTNSTPDIITNSYNIYPSINSVYNIGIIGRVNHVHKGLKLLNSISTILDNHVFKVFGVNTTHSNTFNKNIHLCGEYANNNVFTLIANNNIDFFIFVSVVEETYSYVLSIAMQTGLPIFYNDIGCYRERLTGRTNAYAFSENKLHMLVDLITIMNTSITNNDNITNSNIYRQNREICNVNADFNWMLERNNKCMFDTSIIKDYIINDNVCFIHFTNIGNNYNIFLEQINNIKSSGLYTKLDFIFITMLGPHIKLCSDPKIIVIYYSPDELEFECPTIKLIKSFSYNINKKVNVLYVNICQQTTSYVNYLDQYNHYIDSNRNITYYTEHIAFFNSHVMFNTTKICVFPIYFPQFHTIAENNITFYDGYNDAINLNQLVNTYTNEQFETPSKELFHINNIIDYNLTNNNIIRKQVELLDCFNLDGFAMYYYWFSVNTITNKNTIMEDVINQFFVNDILGKKVFFVWANEDWSNNPAFSKSSSEKILNYYDYDSLTKLKENLITYFLHDNYLKINNKPIFAIHHPWFIPNICITTLTSELNDICIKHGFNGIHIICNNFDKNLDKSYNCYEFHPNYKHSKNIVRDNNKKYLNYDKYLIEDVTNTTDINTIFFDFDNRARLINPDKTHLSTVCVNNSNHNKSKMIRKIFNSYYNKNQDDINNVNNMLFINAWNEWGEKMHIEPSNEKKNYYLEKLGKYIHFHNSYKNYTNLFHKYTLKIASPYSEINYSLINEKNVDKQNITHLHIYDLTYYNEYMPYISVLKDEFHIIITYILGNPDVIDECISVIKCDNVGADIGPKICVLDYLYNNNIDYEYILFLHSKNDLNKRKTYFQFIDSREKIEKILIELKNNSNILAVINNDLLFDFAENSQYNYGTNAYGKEFMNFFNIDPNCETKFSEGNVLLLKKPVLDFIFSDRTTIFYNSLNNYTNSFDLNWTRHKYNDFDSSPSQLYNKITANVSLPGSDFTCESNQQLRDCQIEHLFERIWLYVVKHLGGIYLLV